MKNLNELFVIGIIMFGLLLTPLLFGLLDFKEGVRKAKERGEAITSDGWRRSVTKVSRYYNLLFAFVLVDLMHMSCVWYVNTYYNCHIIIFPFILLFGAIVVAGIEIKSIREKADEKVKKQMNDVAKIAIEIAKHKEDPAEIAIEIAKYLNREIIKE